MSLFEYREGQKIAASDPSFYALIQAAMRRADSFNLERLRAIYPDVYAELQARYDAPGGVLPEEEVEPSRE